MATVGAARAQRYLLPRDVPGVGREVLIHQVLPSGELQCFGVLYPLAGGGFWMDEADKTHGQSEFHPSLPWFLMDTRPQGFWGRAFAQTHADLGLPPQLAYWSDDHILLALVHAGEDLLGNLLVCEAVAVSFCKAAALTARRKVAWAWFRWRCTTRATSASVRNGPQRPCRSAAQGPSV